ncbi:Uncharacterized protein APZ42_017825 [Daphnia magna]|uniref:Uncharacterized protein n=1 Tax=Daphnia magna TaxID=35525 RepID=A0A164ZJT0_9CRUS|nr:Uncharacterized protein APZ42_017825 [Daphnia magna]
MAASVKLVGFCFICKAIYDKENQKVFIVLFLSVNVSRCDCAVFT